mgnify:CR=1 FL=1
MIPQNGDLFRNPSEAEQLLILPDEYPWKALDRMEKMFAQFQSGALPWPANMPPYTEVNRNAQQHVLEIIGAFHSGPVRGGWDVSTDENVYLRGPVYLGRNVKLRKGAVITGPCHIGDGVTIGQGCRVKHSIIRSGTEIQFGTRVAHSVIGANVFVGAGAVLNDRPLSGGEVEIPRATYMRRTGRKHMGLMAGDGALIDGGSVFVSGVILMPEMRVPVACDLVCKPGVYSQFSLTARR